MKSPSHDLAIHLNDNDLGHFPAAPAPFVSDWEISVSQEPLEPATAITLYDTGGDGPDTDELDPIRSTLQVRVRGLDYAEAYEKQEAIRDLLLVGRFSTADSTFVTIDATSDITAIGRDDRDRHILTANYRAVRNRS